VNDPGLGKGASVRLGMERNRPNTTIVGPLIGPETPGEPDELLERARRRVREQDERNKESTRLLRRLIVAFVLVVLLGVFSYAVLPTWGVRLHPMVPALSFIAILVGALLTGSGGEDRGSESDKDPPPDPNGCDDDGCAVGMCPGPRPLKIFREPRGRS